MTPPSAASPARLTAAGLCAWFLVALPTVTGSRSSPRFPFWLLACALYAVAFVAATWRPSERLTATARLLLALQGACVAAMMGLLCNGFEGALLVLAPNLAKRMVTEILTAPPQLLRLGGIVSAAIGVAIVWAIRG